MWGGNGRKDYFLSRDMGRGVEGEGWMGRVGVVVGMNERREDKSGLGWQDEGGGGEDVCEGHRRSGNAM